MRVGLLALWILSPGLSIRSISIHVPLKDRGIITRKRHLYREVLFRVTTRGPRRRRGRRRRLCMLLALLLFLLLVLKVLHRQLVALNLQLLLLLHLELLLLL